MRSISTSLVAWKKTKSSLKDDIDSESVELRMSPCNWHVNTLTKMRTRDFKTLEEVSQFKAKQEFAFDSPMSVVDLGTHLAADLFPEDLAIPAICDPEIIKVIQLCPQPVMETETSLLRLPRDLLELVVSFVRPLEDRSSIARTCWGLYQVMHATQVLKSVPLLGKLDPAHTIKSNEANDDDDCVFLGHEFTKCFIREEDMINPQGLLDRLRPYVAAENGDALYLSGMIYVYCGGLENLKENDNRRRGISLLRDASQRSNHLHSMYSLAIILRDSRPAEANELLHKAHKNDYAAASMEVIGNQELKHRYSNTSDLRKYLDCTPLQKMLRAAFVDTGHHMVHPTSHCWSPNCGRWAYRAGVYFTHDLVMEHAITPTSSETQTLSSPPKKRRLSNINQCARMKMCSSCRRAKYCSKLCQIMDWRCGRHKIDCRHLSAEDNNQEDLQL